MAASFSELEQQIAAAEKVVVAADAHAVESGRALKAHWRAKAPKILIGAGSALLAWQFLKGRRRTSKVAYAAGGGALLRTLNTLLRFGGPRLITAASALAAGFMARKSPELETAPWVDLDRYAGTWYEIARLPEKHEKECASDISATYALAADGGLRVLNRCRRANGSTKRAIGRVEVADPETNSRLRVSFAPSFLSALPFVWSDYWIIEVASDYSWAIVGSPDRKHLWLLAREPTVSDEVLASFLSKSLEQGFDTSALIYSAHTAPANPADPALPTEGPAQPPSNVTSAAGTVSAAK